MQRRGFLFCGAAGLAGLALSGCGGVGMRGGGAFGGADMTALMKQQREAFADIESMGAKQKLMQELMNNPDLPAWHAQREKMALAVGDRTFDRSFERVFDSMTVALATLGSRVNNMERVSGYITASIPSLGPEKLEAMQRDGMRQYAIAKGYPPTVLDRKSGMFDFDAGGMSNMMARGMAGLTLSLVRQGARQTKVKLRFDNVYYPELVGEYYKTVWTAVDKQMFMDQSLD